MIKYYVPFKEIIDYFEKKYNGKKVLEIGPGNIPLPFSTHFIDHFKRTETTTVLNLDTTYLPYSDKEFDFVYCRHVLEDIQNPDFVLQEIIRVAKNFYIETPSPIVETTRHIDGNSPYYRGYIHHRSIIWVSNGVIHFLPKYPIIEYIDFVDYTEILTNPMFWNTYYYVEEGQIPKWKTLKYDIDYNIRTEYKKMIELGVESCKKNVEDFFQKIFNK